MRATATALAGKFTGAFDLETASLGVELLLVLPCRAHHLLLGHIVVRFPQVRAFFLRTVSAEDIVMPVVIER